MLINEHQVLVKNVPETSAEFVLNAFISKAKPATIYKVRALVTANSGSASLPSLQFETSELTFNPSLYRSDYFGGVGGILFDDFLYNDKFSIKRIKSLWIGHSDKIDYLRAEYVLADESQMISSIHGSEDTSTVDRIELTDEERIFTVGVGMNNGVVQSLTFCIGGNDEIRTWGPYGTDNPKQYRYIEDIIAFFGRSGHLLNSVGFYHIPRPIVILIE